MSESRDIGTRHYSFRDPPRFDRNCRATAVTASVAVAVAVEVVVAVAKAMSVAVAVIAVLGHLGAILPPFPAPSHSGKNRPRQPLREFLCQDRFLDLPDPLPTSIFDNFGDNVCNMFDYFLKTVLKDSVSSFEARPKISSRTFF